MPNFLLKIQDAEQIKLFQMLAQQLGVEMTAIAQNEETKENSTETVESSKPKR